MTETIEVLKPLKTWSHLAGRRRRPSEYEIVSKNLHASMNPTRPAFELDPDLPMNVWYRTYRDGSPLQHPDWNAFSDPDEIIYRTYNLMQDGQETYIEGLLDEFNRREYDTGIDPEWLKVLARLHAPARYLFHTLQIASAYLGQVAPASTITNCAYFQAADQLRLVSHTAYRTSELSHSHPDLGFGKEERGLWENDPSWQGFRELMEKVLATYDWGEAFAALNLVAKPAVDECLLRTLGAEARRHGDTLMALLIDGQLRDSDRSRRWTETLVRFALQEPANAAPLQHWVAKWTPLAEQAIQAYCAPLPDGGTLAAEAIERLHTFQSSLGV